MLGTYFILNLAYTFGLKNIPILDISIIVAGFLLRILYGAVIADILVSNWLYLVVISVSFYFALGKRRNEIKKLDGNKLLLQSYDREFASETAMWADVQILGRCVKLQRTL